MNDDWDLWPARVADAPELAILANLDATLETAAIALEAANPELENPPEEGDLQPYSGPLHLARALLISSNSLRQLLNAYRCVRTFIPRARSSDASPAQTFSPKADDMPF
jgi:hypothetical protein